MMRVASRCHLRSFVNALMAGHLMFVLSAYGQNQPRNNGALTINTPSDVETSSDCSSLAAHVAWNVPYSISSCAGPSKIVCSARHSNPSIPQAMADSWILRGGDIGQGTASFECLATDNCGSTQKNQWQVTVSDQYYLDVEVQLSPDMNAGAFSRAITFELFVDCSSYPVSICQVLNFAAQSGAPTDAAMDKAILKIDRDNYKCVIAKDALHTLGSAATPECIDGRWSASWVDDPLLGGNWLVGGNLDGTKKGNSDRNVNTINIVDFCVLMSEIAAGATYGPRGDTTCDTAWPHGDINADGTVDALDFAFIQESFLADDRHGCCPHPLNTPAPIKANHRISVKQLRMDGFAAESVACDLNQDGFVDSDDMKLFMKGERSKAITSKNRQGK